MKIVIMDNAAVTEDIWLDLAKAALMEHNVTSPTMRTLSGLVGQVRCLEEVTVEVPKRSISTCIAPEAHLMASFEGEMQELSSFHSVITSARVGGAK